MVTLGKVSSTPYSGVSVSENLEWGDHISKIAGKANSTLGFLRRNLKECPTKFKDIANYSMFRSLLEYSCPVRDPYRQSGVDKLSKIQRAAARFVTNNYQRKSSVTSLIQDLGWTDLQTRRKNFRLISLYKILHGLIAEYRSTRTHVNSYPCQLVPMSTCTHVNSYHQQMSTRTTSDVNSYHK